MKTFIALLFLFSGLAYGQTNFTAIMVDTNNVVQRPTNGTRINIIPDFYDDFTRYTNGARITNGVFPLIGPSYNYSSGGVGPQTAPFVTNGALINEEDDVFYLYRTLPRNVFNFGAEISWTPNKINEVALAVFVIQPNTFDLQRMIHVSVTANLTSIDVTTNGPIGFVNVGQLTYGGLYSTNAWETLEDGKKHVIVGHINGNVLKINVAGKEASFTNSLISELNGKIFVFEYYGNSGVYTNEGSIFWHKVWANSDKLNPTEVQPRNQRLEEISRNRNVIWKVEGSAPTNTNSVATFAPVTWGDIVIGTNQYKIPLHQ
jgi:hypothetical protein